MRYIKLRFTYLLCLLLPYWLIVKHTTYCPNHYATKPRSRYVVNVKYFVDFFFIDC